MKPRAAYTLAADIFDDIGRHLKHARWQRNVSRRIAAEQMGLSESGVWKIEHGERPRADTAAIILRWLAGEE